MSAMDLNFILKVLFPYLIVLYLIDSAAFVKTHHLLFISPLGRMFRLKGSGVRLAGISPLCRVVGSQNLPIFLTRLGLYVPVDGYFDGSALYGSKDLLLVPYDDMERVEADRNSLKINGRRYLHAYSVLSAGHLAGRINELKDTHPLRRNEKIKRFIDESTDIDDLKTLGESFSRSCYPLQLLCTMLFLFTFFLLPLLVYTRLIETKISFLLIPGALCYLFIVILTYLAHKMLYGAETGERAHILLALILLPVTAMHVISKLSRDLYIQFDYLAVSALLLPKESFLSLARKDIQHMIHMQKGDFPGDLLELWNVREMALLRLVENAGLGVEKILEAPEKKDREAVKYCPVCDTQYRQGFDLCNDCTVHLRDFGEV